MVLLLLAIHCNQVKGKNYDHTFVSFPKRLRGTLEDAWFEINVVALVKSA